MNYISYTSQFGQIAERYVSEYLTSKGYEIIDRNYRKPWGEIDIVASKEGIIIFVEVKANNIVRYGFEAELRADWKKIKKVVRTARTYLLSKKYPDDQPWQIDILSITFVKKEGIARIKHYKNIDI